MAGFINEFLFNNWYHWLLIEKFDFFVCLMMNFGNRKKMAQTPTVVVVRDVKRGVRGTIRRQNYYSIVIVIQLLLITSLTFPPFACFLVYFFRVVFTLSRFLSLCRSVALLNKLKIILYQNV